MIIWQFWPFFKPLDPDLDSESGSGSRRPPESGSNLDPDPKHCLQVTVGFNWLTDYNWSMDYNGLLKDNILNTFKSLITKDWLINYNWLIDWLINNWLIVNNWLIDHWWGTTRLSIPMIEAVCECPERGHGLAQLRVWQAGPTSSLVNTLHTSHSFFCSSEMLFKTVLCLRFRRHCAGYGKLFLIVSAKILATNFFILVLW